MAAKFDHSVTVIVDCITVAMVIGLIFIKHKQITTMKSNFLLCESAEQNESVRPV